VDVAQIRVSLSTALSTYHVRAPALTTLDQKQKSLKSIQQTGGKRQPNLHVMVNYYDLKKAG
jgi:hypothetical protein